MMGPTARVDLSALVHNLSVVRRYAPDSRVWAVVKANAYGHGMIACSRALLGAGVDGLAVARIDEAVELRDAGVEGPLLVLGGAFSVEEVDQAAALGLDLVLHHPRQLEVLEQRSGESSALRLWLKVDTGMHRLGLSPSRVDEVLAGVAALGEQAVLAGLLTHLANADDLEDDLTPRQCAELARIEMAAVLPSSIANSAGVLGWPETHTDWVRPGLMLYGASPLLGRDGASHDLHPVMTLSTPLISVKRLAAGARIGYGGAFACPEDMPVGIAAIGYGDGYPRHAPSGTPLRVAGQPSQLLGRVSMDSIAVDLRAVPDARIGDPVVLWGDGLAVERVAERVGTIAYELMCRLSPRVRLIHVSAHGKEMT